MSGKPVPSVRLYGFVPMTRRRYVFQLVVAGGLAAALLIAWWLRWPEARRLMAPVPSAGWVVRVGDVAPWLILAAVGLQALEAWFVFRALARKERQGLPAR